MESIHSVDQSCHIGTQLSDRPVSDRVTNVISGHIIDQSIWNRDKALTTSVNRVTTLTSLSGTGHNIYQSVWNRDTAVTTSVRSGHNIDQSVWNRDTSVTNRDTILASQSGVHYVRVRSVKRLTSLSLCHNIDQSICNRVTVLTSLSLGHNIDQSICNRVTALTSLSRAH
ncbi:hypothetical protein DPMN_110957 [Dreissena polymorpha]|uniref:Uncharacterized protein n=1 Tax=Dreissena polymorpha TaxID=45954 RepID=A0A9D4KDM0_DREPO|nr:hypothetical protein DPMN_110957 [Dreissena polymorpha]